MVNITLPFAQPWLSSPEPDFHPGEVYVERSKDSLRFWAQLLQPSVMTRATQHQQRLWELGDVVEFFIQRLDCQGYDEYQIAPNGMLLALHYPDRDAVNAVRSGSKQLEQFLAPLPESAHASRSAEGWNAELVIPLAPGAIRLHCGRYDYSSGAPILSCTSPLTKRDFHRLEEWTLLDEEQEF